MLNPLILLAMAYLGVAALAVALTLWRTKGLRRKLLFGGMVLALFAIWPVSSMLTESRQDAQWQAKLDAAQGHFEMRCKSAGEKIVRTVENVEGIVWMKWRDTRNLSDQFKLNDPFGWECDGETCIRLLLRATLGQEIDPEKKMPFHQGFAFVETIRADDNKPVRYTMKLKSGNLDHQELVQRLQERVTARYGVTWDDISSREDREIWIAGGSLKVIDLQTNEVIAERIGYMIDRGLGDKFNGRSPWVFAERSACPAFDEGRRGAEGRNFVQRVLQPTKGE